MAVPSRRNDWRNVLLFGAVGLTAGYFMPHPLSMLRLYAEHDLPKTQQESTEYTKRIEKELQNLKLVQRLKRIQIDTMSRAWNQETTTDDSSNAFTAGYCIHLED